MKALGLACVCLALLVASCGGRVRDAAEKRAEVKSERAQAKPFGLASSAWMSGCGVERAGGSSEESMQFGDMERTYRLAVPKSYDARSPAPLVLNFHGLGSSARQEERYSRIVEVADAHGFIAATVDGTGNPRHWTLAANGTPDDGLRFPEAAGGQSHRFA